MTTKPDELKAIPPIDIPLAVPETLEPLTPDSIDPTVQQIIASLDSWTDHELELLKSGIVVAQKRREQPDAVDEANRICMSRYAEARADFFADCEGVALDRRG